MISKDRPSYEHPMNRLLIASDDRDLNVRHLSELFGGEVVPRAEEVPSDELEQCLVDQGLLVDLARLESVLPRLEQAAATDRHYDAIVLMTIRPHKGRFRVLKEAVEAIRNLPDGLTYSNGLRLKVLPVVIVDIVSVLTGTPPKDLESIQEQGCHVQPAGSNLGEMVSHCVGNWRTELLLELDYIGYAITREETGEYAVSHVLGRPHRESRFFAHGANPQALKRSRYLLLPGDVREAFAPYLELQYLLNHLTEMSARQKKKPELLLHDFFLSHPEMMYRGLYARHWHETLLRHPDPMRRGIQPDFILGPDVPSANGLGYEVLELKRSDHAAVISGRLTERLMRALEQVERYQDYFDRVDTGGEQKRLLGTVIRKPRKALLMGRKLSLDDRRVLQDKQSRSELGGVEIIDYDTLFEIGYRRRAFQEHAIRQSVNL